MSVMRIVATLVRPAVAARSCKQKAGRLKPNMTGGISYFLEPPHDRRFAKRALACRNFRISIMEPCFATHLLYLHRCSNLTARCSKFWPERRIGNVSPCLKYYCTSRTGSLLPYPLLLRVVTHPFILRRGSMPEAEFFTVLLCLIYCIALVCKDTSVHQNKKCLRNNSLYKTVLSELCTK